VPFIAFASISELKLDIEVRLVVLTIQKYSAGFDTHQNILLEIYPNFILSATGN
jgi:hypothetical protein